MVKFNRDKLAEAMFRRAVGYEFEEYTEEKIVDDQTGEVKNVKKKLNRKHSPPDIPAAKAFLEICQEQMKSKYDTMSKEELLAERERLLSELAKN